MPLAKRIVGETGQDGPPIKKGTADTCEVFFQNDARSFFRQLESLVQQADDLFNELYIECGCLVERTRKVKDKVTILTEVVLRLNAREVTVPEGDLSTGVGSTDDHHSTTYGYDCHLFTPSSRPWCIQRHHQTCDVNPVYVIRQCNLFRMDGRAGSAIFSMHPTINSSCASFEIPQPHKTPIAQRTTKSLREPQCTQHQDSTQVTDDCDSASGNRIRLLSQSQPIHLVPVDVSGSNFRQISDRRRSQSQRSHRTPCDFGTSKKTGKQWWRKRSGAISSASGEDPNEDFGFGIRISDDLWKRSPSKERWERARLLGQYEDADSKSTRRKLRLLKQRSKTKKQEELSFCSLRKSFCSMFRPSKEGIDDLWIEGRPEIDELDPLPFTRSQSLPRSFRSAVRKSQSELVGTRSLTSIKAFDTVIQPEADELPTSPSRTLPKVRRIGRQCSEKISSSSSGSLKRSRSLRTSQRSRSLERGATEVNFAGGSQKTVVSPPSVSEAGVTPSDGCREVIVHIPEQPWTKPFATVKLRPQSTKVEVEGYQTSSGNWSNDSACHSMHSDQMTVLLPPGGGNDRQARRSLDKDSAISDSNQSDSLSTSSVHLAQSSSNHLESSCSGSSSTPSSFCSRRKRPNSSATHVKADDIWPHDDATSLFSLDQDGFYTSMHADSGLSRSSHTLTPGDEADNFSDRTESVSSWDANAKNSEQDEDSKTVIFDDWIPATSATKSSQDDEVLELKSVSTDDKMDSMLDKRPEKGLVSVVGDILLSQDKEKYSEILSEPLFESKYGAKSVGFPSFCTVVPNSSEADDASLRGSLKHEAFVDSFPAARMSLGGSQNLCKMNNSSLTAINEIQTNSGNTADFSQSLPGRSQENSNSKSNQKHKNLSIELKQKETSGSEEAGGSSTWPISAVSMTDNAVKGILKSKKKKPLVHSKSINFGPIISEDEILNTNSSVLKISSSEDVSKSVASYGITQFYGSSFLGVCGETRAKKKHENNESKATTNPSNATEDGVLPLKYKPVIVVKPKKRGKDGGIAFSNGPTSSEVTTGYGCLGMDTVAITSCTGISPKDGRFTSRSLTPASKDRNLTPVSAKLVITSPVVERTTYIENPQKRSLCTPLTQQDLQQYSGYNDPGSWYNTLPRKASVRKKIPVSSGCDQTLLARLPNNSDSLRANINKTRMARTVPPGKENNFEVPSSDEVGNTDCFAMNSAKCGTVKRAKTVARSITTVPVLPEVKYESSSIDRRGSKFPISALHQSNQNTDPFTASAKIKHASLDRKSLLSQPRFDTFPSRVISANVSRTSTNPALEKSHTNNALKTDLHRPAKSNSSQIVDQPEAFDTVSPSSRHITQDMKNLIDEQPFDTVSATSRYTRAKRDQVFEGESQNKNHGVFVRTFSSSSSDSSPDVVTSCDGNLTISSTSFAKSQESISSILSALEQNHGAKLAFLSSDSNDVHNDEARSETCDPFSRYTIGKTSPKKPRVLTSSVSSNPVLISPISTKPRSTSPMSTNLRSTSPASTNPKSTEQESAAGQVSSCNTSKTPELSSGSTQLPSTSIKSSLAQGSATQKQSFESDSSGLGSSISGSPTTSPDSDIARLPSSTVLGNPFPKLENSGCVGQSSISPDVIPLIARGECSPLAKTKMRSKQTAV